METGRLPRIGRTRKADEYDCDVILDTGCPVRGIGRLPIVAG